MAFFFHTQKRPAATDWRIFSTSCRMMTTEEIGIINCLLLFGQDRGVAQKRAAPRHISRHCAYWEKQSGTTKQNLLKTCPQNLS